MNQSLPIRGSLAALSSMIFVASAAGATKDVPDTVRRGAWSTFPAGVVMDDATSSGALRLKLADDQTVLPQPMGLAPVGSSVGEYSIAFQFMGGEVDVDAISTGNAIFPAADALGKIHLGDRWFTLTGSVKNGSIGRGTSHFRTAHANNRETGAELATYYLPDSNQVVIPADLIGTTTLETDRTHLGLAATSNEEVKGLDYGMAQMLHAGGPTGFFQNHQILFFSVSPDWADDHAGVPFYYSNPGGSPGDAGSPNAGMVSQLPDTPAHPADVYVMGWYEDGGAWTTPIKFVGWEALGFYADGNLDALEVNAPNGFVLYSGSLRDNGGPVNSIDSSKVQGGAVSQLMYMEVDFDGYPSTYIPRAALDTNGRRIANKIGVRDNVTGDDLDATCGLDPEASSFTPMTAFAVPVHTISYFGKPMGISAVRGWDPVTSSEAQFIHISGWGKADPVRSVVRILKSTTPVDSDVSWRTATWTVEDVSFRNTFDMNTTYKLPHLAPLSSFYNPTPYWYYAEARNEAGQVIAVSMVNAMSL